MATYKIQIEPNAFRSTTGSFPGKSRYNSGLQSWMATACVELPQGTLPNSPIPQFPCQTSKLHLCLELPDKTNAQHSSAICVVPLYNCLAPWPTFLLPFLGLKAGHHVRQSSWEKHTKQHKGIRHYARRKGTETPRNGQASSIRKSSLPVWQENRLLWKPSKRL